MLRESSPICLYPAIGETVDERMAKRCEVQIAYAFDREYPVLHILPNRSFCFPSQPRSSRRINIDHRPTSVQLQRLSPSASPKNISHIWIVVSPNTLAIFCAI